MKGLILKDLYASKSYGLIYVLFLVVYAAMVVINGASPIGALPCLLLGMLPSALQAADEGSRWLQYSACLPYTRSQIVSAKYIISIIFNVASAAVLLIANILNAVFVEHDLSQLASLPIWAALYLSVGIFGALCLPFIFWLGVEKGRIVYMVFCGLMGAGIGAIGATSADLVFGEIPNIAVIMAAVFAIAAALFAISWAASIAAFKKRQL